jgi:hypothetical protein
MVRMRMLRRLALAALCGVAGLHGGAPAMARGGSTTAPPATGSPASIGSCPATCAPWMRSTVAPPGAMPRAITAGPGSRPNDREKTNRYLMSLGYRVSF